MIGETVLLQGAYRSSARLACEIQIVPNQPLTVFALTMRLTCCVTHGPFLLLHPIQIACAPRHMDRLLLRPFKLRVHHYRK